MPKEPRARVLPMGIISAETTVGGNKKLKFASKVAALGTSIKRSDKQVEMAKKLKKKKAGTTSSTADGVGASMVFNKGHGQHILKNPLVIQAIVEKSSIKPTDIVVEIGPGTGNLTEKLLMAAKKVIAFEIDPRMVSELHKRFNGSPLQHKLTVIQGNCLEQEFPYFDKCVANVPYAISSALVFKLLKTPTFKCAVLMFQREFALRVCAPPGTEAYSRLSVNSQLLARCSHLMKISKNSFNPPPKVESSVIRLDPKHPPPPVAFDEWDGLVKLMFNRKNKKVSSIFRTKAAIGDLHKIYSSYCKMEERADLEDEAFKNLIDSLLEHPLMERRARTLDLDDITEILDHFNKNGVHFA